MKYILIVVLTLFLISCEKDEIPEKKEPEKNCACGFITDDGIESGNYSSKYWIEVRNDCSGNIQRFYMTQGDWMNAHPGNNICWTNVQSWK